MSIYFVLTSLLIILNSCIIFIATANCFLFAFLKYCSFILATISISAQPSLSFTASPVSPPPPPLVFLSGIPIICLYASSKYSLMFCIPSASNCWYINFASGFFSTSPAIRFSILFSFTFSIVSLFKSAFNTTSKLFITFSTSFNVSEANWFIASSTDIATSTSPIKNPLFSTCVIGFNPIGFPILYIFTFVLSTKLKFPLATI